MFYIHHTVCISPQISFLETELDQLINYNENKMHTQEVSYEGIPTAVLRRMGKAVRLGVAASAPLFKMYEKLDGIIIGTANGGLEDSVKFLNQIMEYEEGVLTPTNFVQSTSNAIASQLGFLSKNKDYNITHVHKGLAFENAIIDVEMLLEESPKANYLLGGLDEICNYNFNIECLCGHIKKEKTNSNDLYNNKSQGSIAGEGVAMFIVNKEPKKAISSFRAIKTIHTTDGSELIEIFKTFLNEHLSKNELVDLFLSGESGDSRYLNYFESMESLMKDDVTIARYKHMSGEYQTASAFALWVSNYIFQTQHIPQHMIKRQNKKKDINNIIIYNNYLGFQHSFMLLSKI
jgi:hypothetical protein